MPYVLGIHLGGTTTTAAIARRDGVKWAAAAPVPLGNGPRGAAGVPTVLCKVQDGSFVAGEPARSQELMHHEWVVRGFTKRVGDDLPMFVGNDFVAPQQLVAVMIEWVADQVAHRLGHPANHITVAHDVEWGPHRAHLVRQALAGLGIHDVTLVPEPVAVGFDYGSKQRVDEGAMLAVGDVGGSGMDATVLRRRGNGFEVVGAPLYLPHPSGTDLDDAVLGHVRTELGAEWDPFDLDASNDRAASRGLRDECTRVKEALSYQPHASVRVELPGSRNEAGHSRGVAQNEIALSRSRYEQLVRPHLERVPEVLSQAIQSAAGTPDELDAVVLAGGTARTPLLKELVAQGLSQPQVDAVPELVAASGAAAAAVRAMSTGGDLAETVAETNVLMRVEEKKPAVGGAAALVDRGPDEPSHEMPPVHRPPIEIERMYVEPPDERRALRAKILKLTLAAALILLGLYLTLYPPPGMSGGSGLLG